MSNWRAGGHFRVDERSPGFRWDSVIKTVQGLLGLSVERVALDG